MNLVTLFRLILQFEDHRVKVSVPHTQVILDLQDICFNAILLQDSS
jgi:hypothetical protein